MSTLSDSFTDVGVSVGMLVVPDQTVTFGLSGTYAATLVFEKTLDGGQTWTEYASYSTPNATVSASVGDPGTYRWRCSDFTSGSADYTIESNAYQILFPAVRNQAGEVVFEVTSEGITTKTVTESDPVGGLTGITDATTTALGDGAADSLTSGANNTAIGVNVLTAATSGANNTAVGNNAAASVTTGGNNVAIGRNAMAGQTTANSSIAIGQSSGKGGASNVSVGDSAGFSLTTGHDNVLAGDTAGYSVTTGLNNVAVGSASLQNNVTGSDNVAAGKSSLLGVTGDKNTAVGSLAGGEITVGTGNALLGYEAGKSQGNVSNQFMVGLGNGQGLIFTIDEMGNLLNIAVRYADGTMKAVAPLALT